MVRKAQCTAQYACDIINILSATNLDSTTMYLGKAIMTQQQSHCLSSSAQLLACTGAGIMAQALKRLRLCQKLLVYYTKAVHHNAWRHANCIHLFEAELLAANTGDAMHIVHMHSVIKHNDVGCKHRLCPAYCVHAFCHQRNDVGCKHRLCPAYCAHAFCKQHRPYILHIVHMHSVIDTMNAMTDLDPSKLPACNQPGRCGMWLLHPTQTSHRTCSLHATTTSSSCIAHQECPNVRNVYFLIASVLWKTIVPASLRRLATLQGPLNATRSSQIAQRRSPPFRVTDKTSSMLILKLLK